jgi:uncharacterized protein (TIGR02996 family)
MYEHGANQYNPPEGLSSARWLTYPNIENENGPAETLGEVGPYYHPRQDISDYLTSFDRVGNAHGTLNELRHYSIQGDPYRIFAASVLGGNRHAIPFLVGHLKARDNPAGWWKGWTDLHRRLEREQGNLPPEQVADRLHKIATVTTDHSHDPQGHKAIAEQARDDVTRFKPTDFSFVREGSDNLRERKEFVFKAKDNSMYSGWGRTQEEAAQDITNFMNGQRSHIDHMGTAANGIPLGLTTNLNRNWQAYRVLADHMEENGLEHYAALIRSELANVLPDILRKPKGKRRFSRRGKVKRYMQSDEEMLQQPIIDADMSRINNNTPAQPMNTLIYADWLEEHGRPATAELIRLHQHRVHGYRLAKYYPTITSRTDTYTPIPFDPETQSQDVIHPHSATELYTTDWKEARQGWVNRNRRIQVGLSFPTVVGKHRLSWQVSLPVKKAIPLIHNLEQEHGVKQSELTETEEPGYISKLLTQYRASLNKQPKRYAAQPTQSLAGALLGSTATGHNNSAVIKDIVTQLQLTPAIATDVVHHGPNGSVPNMMVRLNHAGNVPKSNYAASWMGLMTNTPGLVVFHPGNGQDLLHTVEMRGSGNEVVGSLHKYGIKDMVLAPTKVGFKAIIFDHNSKLGASLQQLSRERKGNINSQRGTGMFIGSHKLDKARAAYRQYIRNYEAQQQQPQEQPKRMSRSGKLRYSQPTQDELHSFLTTTGGGEAIPDYMRNVGVYSDYLEEGGMPATAEMLRLHLNQYKHPFGLSGNSMSVGNKEVSAFPVHGGNIVYRGSEPGGRVHVEIRHLLPPGKRLHGGSNIHWYAHLPTLEAKELVSRLMEEGHHPAESVYHTFPGLTPQEQPKRMSRDYDKKQIDGYFKNSLGLKREEAPQIPDDKKEQFVKELEKQGIGSVTKNVDPIHLRPTQSEWNDKSLAKIDSDWEAGGEKHDFLLNNRVTVSNDGYIIDGHHRWVDARLRGRKLKVLEIDLPIDELLVKAREFGKANSIERKSA